MRDLTTGPAAIPSMTSAAIAKVRAFEDASLETLPQVEIPTEHVIHGGMYARTIPMLAGTVLTGALIKLATILIVSGDAAVYIGGEAVELQGYTVLPASAGRKQLIVARTDLHLTMIFPTAAETVEQAEEEFTDEAARLFSRLPTARNRFIITGE